MVSATVVSISQSYENIPVVADVFAQNYDSGAPGAADVLVRQPGDILLSEILSHAPDELKNYELICQLYVFLVNL